MLSQWLLNMVKVLSFRFEQCLGPYTMLLVEGSSERGLFTHISNIVFRSPLVQKYISYECHFFFENVQNWIWVSKMRKQNGEKVFCFWDIWIWTCYIKLFLLSREYLSSAVNLLTNSPKILYITKRDFFQLSCLHSDQ